MARITVEDCILKVPNRFELVMLAAQRARDISAGAALTLDRDNDKNPVVALREIAEGTIELDHLRYELIHGLRRHLEAEDRPDEDLMALESQFSDEAGGQALAGARSDEGTDEPQALDDPVPDAMEVVAEDEEEAGAEAGVEDEEGYADEYAGEED